MRSMILVLLCASTTFAQTTPPDEPPQTETAPADSSETLRFLDEIQALDDAFFDDDATRTDTSYRDSLVTNFEELGFEAYRDQSDATMRTFRWDLGPFSPLWSYNRVEGIVPSARLEVRPLGPRGPTLLGDAGWATGPGALRWASELRVPIPRVRSTGRGGGTFFFAGWIDRVEPYGSNRPFANSLRALVAGADEMDYLHRRGGRVGVAWRTRGASASIEYAAARELSVSAPASFALTGDLPTVNRPIEEGIDRALDARIEWGTGTLAPWTLRLGHRVAGGVLAGDFDYARTDLFVRRRNYVGRWELQTEATWARTIGNAPVQRLADAGGVSSVRGFPRRTLVGDQSVLLRAELPVPFDVLRRTGIPLLRDTGVQFVPWADAAWVEAEDDGTWIHSIGLGIQRHWIGLGRAANVRLDVAVPIGRDRPADVVFLVRFAGS